MRLRNLLDPRYVAARRRRIVPYIGLRANRALGWIQSRLASRGMLLTRRERRLAQLKDAYLGARCFVIGNGASLKGQDLSPLEDEHVFVVNWFVLHERFPRFRRPIFCSSDPHLWNHGEGLHPELMELIPRNPAITCFFESSAALALRGKAPVPPERLFFVRLDRSRQVADGHFSTDLLAGTCWGHTVIIDLCLPVAFYLGFSTVYLIGCDCDYRLAEAEDFSRSFFYDIRRVPDIDRAHVRRQWERLDAAALYGRWVDAYRCVKQRFEAAGRAVYNAGEGGRLDVFDRVGFRSLF